MVNPVTWVVTVPCCRQAGGQLPVTWGCDCILLPAGGRLLLHVPLGAESAGALRRRERKEARPAAVAPGTLVSGTVSSVHAAHAAVQLEGGVNPIYAISRHPFRLGTCCVHRI